MERRVILPKTYIENIEMPLIFLAGPIRDAPDWQEKAIDYLVTKDEEIAIVNPRWDAKRKVVEQSMDGIRNHFKRQREWERHYLDLGYEKGAVLFWLAEAPGYMTRLELGQAMTRYKFRKPTNFCVGGENTFNDIETIEYDLFIDAGKQIFRTQKLVEIGRAHV